MKPPRGTLIEDQGKRRLDRRALFDGAGIGAHVNRMRSHASLHRREVLVGAHRRTTSGCDVVGVTL